MCGCVDCEEPKSGSLLLTTGKLQLASLFLWFTQRTIESRAEIHTLLNVLKKVKRDPRLTMCWHLFNRCISGADPEPQDRGCTGEIAININTKSAYTIASYTSPFLYGLWLVIVGKGGWRERNFGKRGYLLSYETALRSTRYQLSI